MPAILSPSSHTPRTPHRPSKPPDISAVSPGYFGLSIDGSNTTANSSGARAMRRSYSPPGSGIRSAAASPPQTLPFHSQTNTSELDAFRKEVNRNRSSYHDTKSAPSKTAESTIKNLRGAFEPSPESSTTHTANTQLKNKTSTPAIESVDCASPQQLESTLRSPKRALSTYATDHDRPRPESPAPPSKPCEPKMPRLSGIESFPHEPVKVPSTVSFHRAETLPEKFDPGNPAMITSQHVATLFESHAVDETLVLDLRVVTQYADSHINGALNLCVPTTLLKRPSYNVAKLADTFKDGQQRSKFQTWQKCNRIIVYDANTSQMKEAANCINILKKFVSEGWTGESCIVKGGFADFSKKFPGHLNKSPKGARKASVPSLSLKIDDPSVAPVIGGCPMPATKDAANPFFGNIRQNMDLIGGVGQMSVKFPSGATHDQLSRLPAWLKHASSPKDEGKIVSDRFLRIEKREQKRMQEALSGNVTYGTPRSDAPKKVTIAGIEKGAKNRYNNIWPFEHSRVRLDGIPESGCDYINANHVATSHSEKSYIATQGPIPATFADFWNMVWQNEVRVIVMLTAESEGGQVKAHNYWKSGEYGSCKLHHLEGDHRASLDPSKIRRHKERMTNRRRSSHIGSEDTSGNPGDVCGPKLDSPTSPTSEPPHVIVRKFTLLHKDNPFEHMREITQLQYSSWPDFGAPADPAHVLGLVQQCDAVVRVSAGSKPIHERPVLVHCSAGCGRTGTFCTIDSVIDMISNQQSARQSTGRRLASPKPVEIDNDNPFFSQVAKTDEDHSSAWLKTDEVDLIEKTVEEFRLQRLSMVQSLRQFVLCYETVIRWLLDQDQAQGD